MKEFRSASQILFGHLPEQTIDADGGIWKVKRWNDPKTESAIDSAALRDELIRAASPWRENKVDGGFVDDLFQQRVVRVRTLNKEEGIWCEPFPKLYLCQSCKRLHDESRGKCECGSTRKRGQLPFVGYHDVCGSIKTPYVKKCAKHGQRAVRFPGTASAAELIFFCPVCNDVIHRGFGAACDCDQGGALSFTIHRSGTVFKPRSISMINPPRREIVAQIDSAGGGERALEWIIGGMKGAKVTDAPPTQSSSSIRKLLEDQGYNAATVDAMLAAMPSTTHDTNESVNAIPSEIRIEAEREARQVALATFESRVTVQDLIQRAETQGVQELYENNYAESLTRAGLDRVELVDRFPVLTAQYGYTRGASKPGDSKLRTYRESNGDYSVYGELAQSEALFIRLSPLRVLGWLRSLGFDLNHTDNSRSAAVNILMKMGAPDTPNELTAQVTELVHSYSHALIKRAAVFAGIERSSLSELVLPTTFGFFIYAAARGDFVLGGLQALFESELCNLLEGLVDDEHRCALDPGCEDNGAACAVCLHLGEPSCRMYNTCLSRKALAGGSGYFDFNGSPQSSQSSP